MNDGRLPSRQDFDSETLLSFGGRIALIEIDQIRDDIATVWSAHRLRPLSDAV